MIQKLLTTLLLALPAFGHSVTGHKQICVIPAAGDGRDDSPAIREAFQKCGTNGKVVFEKDMTYSVQTVLQLHDLKNVEVDLLGTIEVFGIILLSCFSKITHS